MDIDLQYPSGAASLFSLHARKEIADETVACPKCHQAKAEYLGSTIRNGRVIRFYQCHSCGKEFERTVEDGIRR